MAYVIGDDCIACGTCQGECPVEAIKEGDVVKVSNLLWLKLNKRKEGALVFGGTLCMVLFGVALSN